MPSRNAQPIWDPKIRNEIQNFNLGTATTIGLNDYLDTFRSWLSSGQHSTLKDLDTFPYATFCHGTIQAFDQFYIKHRFRRFRFLKGEFMYHQACLKHGFYWKYLDNDLESYDALIISIPFSDSGSMTENFNKIIKRCNDLDIPVLIDLAYFPLSKFLNLSLNYKCIETITASLSKVFDGAQYLRAGIRFQRENIDDGIDVANSVSMLPNHTLATAYYLMNNYSIDYNWNKYEETYKIICNRLRLKFTNCLMFGISFDNYKEYNRGNDWNRVCISEDIGKEYASTKL